MGRLNLGRHLLELLHNLKNQGTHPLLHRFVLLTEFETQMRVLSSLLPVTSELDYLVSKALEMRDVVVFIFLQLQSLSVFVHQHEA